MELLNSFNKRFFDKKTVLDEFGTGLHLFLVIAGLGCFGALLCLWFSKGLFWFCPSGTNAAFKYVVKHYSAISAAGSLSFLSCSDYSPLLFSFAALFFYLCFPSLSFVSIVVYNILCVLLAVPGLGCLSGRRRLGPAVILYLSLLVHFPFISSFAMETVFPALLFFLLVCFDRMFETRSYQAALCAAVFLAAGILIKETFVLYCIGPAVFILFFRLRRFWTGTFLMLFIALSVYVIVPKLLGIPSIETRLLYSRYFTEVVQEGNLSSWGSFDSVVYVFQDNLRSLIYSFAGFSAVSAAVHCLFLVGLFAPKQERDKWVYASYFGFVVFLLFYPSGKTKISFYYPMYGLACVGAVNALASISGLLKYRRTVFFSVLLFFAVHACFTMNGKPVQKIVFGSYTFRGIDINQAHEILSKDNPGSVNLYLMANREELLILGYLYLFFPDMKAGFSCSALTQTDVFSDKEFCKIFEKRRQQDLNEENCYVVLPRVPAGRKNMLAGKIKLFPTGECFYVLKPSLGDK